MSGLFEVTLINCSEPEREFSERRMTLEEIGEEFPELVEAARREDFVFVHCLIGDDRVHIVSQKIADYYAELAARYAGEEE